MKTLNTDDIFLRNLSISFLELLNSTMNISISRNDTKEIHPVPFMYNYGTDEGFLKDFYIGLPDNCNIPVSEGTYDMIPRGIITLSSFQVKNSDITNRFVRGQYTEVEKGSQEENVLTGYSAQLYSLPLAVRFDIKVITGSINQAFKTAENILDLVYSNRVMYFQYKGIRVPAQFHFPEQETIDKKYVFTYADNNKLHVNAAVEVETYFLSFEQSSKRHSRNVMERILVREFDADDHLLNKVWVDENTAPVPPEE
jgi:hypothetical protein